MVLEEVTQDFTDVSSDLKSWDPFADIPGLSVAAGEVKQLI